MSTELIRVNINVREEMIILYDSEISNNKNEDLINYIKTEKEKILHQMRMDSGLYKDKPAPSAWNYFTGYSDGKKIVVMKNYISMMAYHYNTNDSLSFETKQYIDSKIKVIYNHVGKLITKLNKRQEKKINHERH